ncbi:MAG: hypothetical protein AAFY41_19730, partial [Bacteroidota bacterium]
KTIDTASFASFNGYLLFLKLPAIRDISFLRYFRFIAIEQINMTLFTLSLNQAQRFFSELI